MLHLSYFVQVEEIKPRVRETTDERGQLFKTVKRDEPNKRSKRRKKNGKLLNKIQDLWENLWNTFLAFFLFHRENSLFFPNYFLVHPRITPKSFRGEFKMSKKKHITALYFQAKLSLFSRGIRLQLCTSDGDGREVGECRRKYMNGFIISETSPRSQFFEKFTALPRNVLKRVFLFIIIKKKVVRRDLITRAKT